MLTADVEVDRGEEAALGETDEAGHHGEDDAAADELVAQVLATDRAGGGLDQVPEHEAEGEHQGGEEATARGLVAAVEGHERVHDQHGEHRPDDLSSQDRVQVGAPQVLGVEGCELRDLVHVGELGGPLLAEEFGGRAGAVAGHRRLRHRADDRGDDQAGHAEHRQLAEGIQCTELHEDRRHDVVGLGNLRGLGDVPLSQLRPRVAADEQPDTHEDDQADHGGEGDGELRAVLAFLEEQAGLVPDDQHEEHGDDELDHQVGQRDIRGTECQHDPGDTDTGDAGEDHRTHAGAGGDDRHGHQEHDQQARDVADLVDAVFTRGQLADELQATGPEEGGDGEHQDHREDPQQVRVGAQGVAQSADQAAPPAGQAQCECDQLVAGEGEEPVVLQPVGHGLTSGQQQAADDHDGDGDEQWQPEPVPQGQVGVRLPGPGGSHHGVDRAIEESEDGDDRQGHQAGQDRGQPEGHRGLGDLATVEPGVVLGGGGTGVDEGANDVLRRVHEGRQRAEAGGDEEDDLGPGGQLGVGERLEHAFLGDEAEQWRQAGHAGSAD